MINPALFRCLRIFVVLFDSWNHNAPRNNPWAHHKTRPCCRLCIFSPLYRRESIISGAKHSMPRTPASWAHYVGSHCTLWQNAGLWENDVIGRTLGRRSAWLVGGYACADTHFDFLTAAIIDSLRATRGRSTGCSSLTLFLPTSSIKIFFVRKT